MMAGRSFLLIDGDPASSHALAEQLAAADGVRVTLSISAAEAHSRTGLEDYDLVVVSTPPADPDDGAALDRLRAAVPDRPILLLVAAGAAAGPPPAWADDFLVRPFRVSMLLARIRLLLERRPDPGFAIGPYRFLATERLLVDRAGAREIRLTEKEAAILHYLAEAGDRPTPRELLLNEVWGYNSAVTTHTLETHVYRLRRKIESDPANAEILLCEPGGYRLAAGIVAGAGDDAMGRFES